MYLRGRLKYKCVHGRSLERYEYEQTSEDEWVDPSKCILDELWGRDQIGLGPDKTS